MYHNTRKSCASYVEQATSPGPPWYRRTAVACEPVSQCALNRRLLLPATNGITVVPPIVAPGQTVPSQVKQPTDRPTMHWIFSCFEGISLIRFRRTAHCSKKSKASSCFTSRRSRSWGSPARNPIHGVHEAGMGTLAAVSGTHTVLRAGRPPSIDPAYLGAWLLTACGRASCTRPTLCHGPCRPARTPAPRSHVSCIPMMKLRSGTTPGSAPAL